MTELSPITPPPELVQQWLEDSPEDDELGIAGYIATQAARWGGDQELEACCEWLVDEGHEYEHVALRDARRPKPPSLKELALEELSLISISPESGVRVSALDTIRRALEALPE